MKITKIEQQKKNPERYNIFIDGRFATGLYAETILVYAIRSGEEISQEKLDELKNKDTYIYAKQAAYVYLSYKPRSADEVRKKLQSKEIPEDITERVITDMQEFGYINDTHLAELMVESKTSGKPMGRRMVKIKLMQKGLDKETIEEAVTNKYSDEKELEMAIKLLGKYKKKIHTDNEHEVKQKCFRYLASRGFPTEVITKALNTSEE